MTALCISDFTPGSIYTVRVNEEVLALTLDKAQLLSDSGREGGSFRLEFLGPRVPLLLQATYAFSSDARTDDVFIVPIAREADAIRYEAVFY